MFGTNKKLLAVAIIFGALGLSACATSTDVEKAYHDGLIDGQKKVASSIDLVDTGNRQGDPGSFEGNRFDDSHDVAPLPKAVAKAKACNSGVHFERFSTRAMSPAQFQELQDYLRNANCASRPQPAWLTETDWSYGKTIPSKGSFTMNGITIEFWEITR